MFAVLINRLCAVEFLLKDWYDNEKVEGRRDNEQ